MGASSSQNYKNNIDNKDTKVTLINNFCNRFLKARGIDRKGIAPSLLCPWPFSKYLVVLVDIVMTTWNCFSLPWKWLSFRSEMKTTSSKVTCVAQSAGPNSNVTVRERMGPMAQSLLQSWKHGPWGSHKSSVGFLLNSAPNVTSLECPFCSCTLGLHKSTCGLFCPWTLLSSCFSLKRKCLLNSSEVPRNNELGDTWGASSQGHRSL